MTAREMAAEVEGVVGVATPTEVGEWVEQVAFGELSDRAHRLEEMERFTPTSPEPLGARDGRPRAQITGLALWAWRGNALAGRDAARLRSIGARCSHDHRRRPCLRRAGPGGLGTRHGRLWIRWPRRPPPGRCAPKNLRLSLRPRAGSLSRMPAVWRTQAAARQPAGDDPFSPPRARRGGARPPVLHRPRGVLRPLHN